MINEATRSQSQLKPFAGASFTRNHRDIDGYLTDEGLALSSAEARSDMVQIAILKRFNANLCRAVCATEDATRITDQIWREARKLIPESALIEWIQESLPIEQQSVWLVPILQHRTSIVSESTHAKRAQTVPVLALLEPLSEREFDVLKRLASELSGPEISAQLFISINTFRTHTKNLYSKLQVNSRRAVVRRAKELGIL
jgi:ATP/maltotriose-dependent transcriptional regulator MalT